MADMMKAAVFEKPKQVTIKQVPVPQIPVNLTRIRTSSAPMVGTGTSLITSFSGAS